MSNETRLPIYHKNEFVRVDIDFSESTGRIATQLCPDDGIRSDRAFEDLYSSTANDIEFLSALWDRKDLTIGEKIMLTFAQGWQKGIIKSHARNGLTSMK